MLNKTKDKTKFRNKFLGGKKEQFEQDRVALKKLHKEDDINKSVSQFLSHGISTDSFQCETVEKLPGLQQGMGHGIFKAQYEIDIPDPCFGKFI